MEMASSVCPVATLTAADASSSSVIGSRSLSAKRRHIGGSSLAASSLVPAPPRCAARSARRPGSADDGRPASPSTRCSRRTADASDVAATCMASSR
jgi:hypothetical protein